MSENEYIPCLSISPNYCTSFYQYNGYRKTTKLNRFNLQTVSNEDTFSKTSQKKLRNYVNWFCEQSKYKVVVNKSRRIKKYYKLALLTLTLPYSQHYSDETIKKELLNQFLTEARQRFGLKHYIWRAEKQKNGNIHFHIIVDIFMSWQEVRSIWNRICDKLDLVKLWQAKMKAKYELGFNYTEDELKRFGLYTLKRRYREGKKNNWTNPNSIDIHSLKKINNVAAYIVKYMSKDVDDENLKVSGRNWYVSKSIKDNCKNLVIEVSDDIAKEFESITEGENNLIKQDLFFRVYSVSINYLIKNTQKIKAIILEYLEKMRYNLSLT